MDRNRYLDTQLTLDLDDLLLQNEMDFVEAFSCPEQSCGQCTLEHQWTYTPPCAALNEYASQNSYEPTFGVMHSEREDVKVEHLYTQDLHSVSLNNSSTTVLKRTTKLAKMSQDVIDLTEIFDNQFQDVEKKRRLSSMSFFSQQEPPRTKKRRTSRFRGVSKCSDDTKFQARIRTGSTVRYLGRFTTEEEAARTYDVAAKHFHKEKAKLNFPQAPSSI